LAQSLFGRKGGIISLLTGHLFTCHWDESGTDPGTGGKSKADVPIILVGGYFAHVRDWVGFDEKWNAILDKYDLPYFHMVDFANKNRPYFLMAEEKYNAVISDVLDSIAEFPRFRHAVALAVDDYREVVKADNIGNEDIVRAYHMCARKCIEFISDLAREANHKPKILHIFDAGNAAWPSFQATFTDEMLASLNILRPIEQSKIDVLGLQAADVLAHQSARQLLIDSGKAKQPLRLYTERLHRKPGFTLCATKTEVRRWYEEELYLEGQRRQRSYPRRITRIDLRQSASVLSQLFAEPEEHVLTSMLRAHQ
jgi:hypothetical protein